MCDYVTCVRDQNYFCSVLNRRHAFLRGNVSIGGVIDLACHFVLEIKSDPKNVASLKFERNLKIKFIEKQT